MKKGTAWDDLEFLERAMEFADDRTRKEFSTIIKQARYRITDIMDRDYIRGTLTPTTFRNILGHEPDRAAIRRKLGFLTPAPAEQ